MKELESILEGIDILEKRGPENPGVRSICFDSRKLKKNDLFVAVPGTLTDGHSFIGQAVASGSSAVICEKIPEPLPGECTYIRVADSAAALGLLAASYYGNPSEKVKVIGVTGTNGKTTVATLLYRLFSEAGSRAGLISTVCNYIGKDETEAAHTTPDAVRIQELLAGMAENECVYCFMEVSSHSIHQKRIAGIQFSGGIFTNITHEHLDYHKTFKNYIGVKKSFFDQLPPYSFALINMDDRNGNVMLQNCRASGSGYGMQGIRDFKARILESHLDGMHLLVDGQELWTGFSGRFNAYNLLAVYAAAVLCGMDKRKVLILLSKLGPVRGRFETMRSDSGITAIIDYAHTPDALKNVLSAIAQVNTGKAMLITVVGAGGNRDSAKRPLMGGVAAAMSSRVILTSDNPRNEDPEDIIRQMMEGVPAERLKDVLSIPDRRQAIKTAVMMATEGDIILVAGKGHETYQETGGKRIHFDDREVIREFLA
jgi:UDP-N-acetylmuramoyl-L-alanyl-D-glutamate--2,6-diaminopimelate ligase